MDVAQIYMLALRSTLVPIAGESWAAMPFFGQVELEGWSWDLNNAEAKVDAELERDKYSKNASNLAEDKSKKISEKFEGAHKALDNRADRRELEQLRAQKERAMAAMKQRGDKIDLVRDFADVDKIDSRIDSLMNDINARTDKATQEIKKGKSQMEKDLETAKEEDGKALTRAEKIEELQAKNFEFTFRKRVDISTTQLLNCLKSGDKLKTVTLTMHQSSSNTPWFLVFTLTGVRLKDYKLRVETSDTMTDMKEDWTAEFQSFGYVYQNRPHAGVKALTAGHANTTAARVATQSTVRTFAMMPRRGSMPF